MIQTFSPASVNAPQLFPDGHVIYDDNFSSGFCGWEELVSPAGNFAQLLYPPISLSPHGHFGNYSLLLQTNDVAGTSYGTGAFAIKRVSQVYLPTAQGVVTAEWWFSYGSNNPNLNGTTGFPGAPAILFFEIDSMTDASTQTSVVPGLRAYFQAQWLPQSSGQWQFTVATTATYGNSGYVQPQNNVQLSGFYSNFFFNENKRNLNYFSLTVNVKTGQYLSMTAGGQTFNLAQCPTGALNPPVAAGDPTYNQIDFGGGINQVMGVTNRNATNPTASYVELHRARLSWR